MTAWWANDGKNEMQSYFRAHVLHVLSGMSIKCTYTLWTFLFGVFVKAFQQQHISAFIKSQRCHFHTFELKSTLFEISVKERKRCNGKKKPEISKGDMMTLDSGFGLKFVLCGKFSIESMIMHIAQVSQLFCSSFTTHRVRCIRK